jgi:HEAT repeat protein
MVTRLNQVRAGTEADEAVAALVSNGDVATAEITRQLAGKVLDRGGQYQAVRILQTINSEQARETLRRMALREAGKGGGEVEGRAAQALLKSDPRQIRALLKSTYPQVLLPVLNALDGKTLDEELVKQLKVCLTNKDGPVRWRAAAVLANGTSGALAVEAVEAIGDALTAAAEPPKANTLYPRGGGNTYLERSALPYISALEAAGVDNGQLAELATRLQGRARDAVVLAQGLRGDQTVRPEVVKLAKDPEAGMFRTWAAEALGRVGTKEDLPLLQQLANADPLEREGPLPAPAPLHSMGTTYPVRQAAKLSIKRIEKQ